jgi:hypothetical protein
VEEKGIGSAVIYQRRAAEKAAAILQQHQRDAEEQKKRYENFRQQVEKDKKKHSSAAGNEGKTWKTYIPLTRECPDDVDSFVSPNSTKRESRRELALPVHE